MPEYVTIERFEDRCKSSDKIFEEIKTDIGGIQKELGSKVSWTVFWSIFSLLVTIMIVAFGILYREVKEVKDTANITSQNVSYMRGVLDNAQITK